MAYSQDKMKLHDKDFHQIGAAIPLPPPPMPPQRPSNNTVISLPEVVVNDRISNYKFKSFDFDHLSIRQAFIRKVYSIVMVQVLVTMGFVCLFTFHQPTRMFTRNLLVLWVALAFYFITYFCILCCEGPRRVVPWNYIFLGVFTVALSFMVGCCTIVCEGYTMLLAVGLTLAIVLSLTLFALQTKIDFTMMSGSLLSMLVILFFIGLVAAISGNPTIDLVYTGVGVLVASLILVYTTQRMVGGDYKYALSPEEYVFAALNIYVDTMSIFLRLLRFMCFHIWFRSF